MVVGVLALQGNFEEHGVVLDRLSMNTLFVRSVEDLSQVNALILPGGESTVMMKLLRASGLDTAIIECVQHGMPVFGTCAGAILLSDSHLQLMDISVDRNAYGSQHQSFSAPINIGGTSVTASFIRAPKITRVGEQVQVLAKYNDVPVLVQQGNVLVSTFHTETTGDATLHQKWLSNDWVHQNWNLRAI